MDESFSAQLRKESISFIIPAVGLLSLLMLWGWAILLPAVWWGRSGVIALFLMSGVVGSSWYFLQKGKTDWAGNLFLGGYLLLFSFVFVLTQDEATIYLCGVLIVSAGLMKYKEASLIVWLISAILVLSTFLWLNIFDRTTLVSVVPSLFSNLLLAIVTFLGLIEWERALFWAEKTNEKANRQKNELLVTYEELKESNKETNFLYKQLAITLTMGRQITSILDIDQLLNQVVHQIQTEFEHSYAAVFLLNGKETKLELGAESGGMAERGEEPVPILVAIKDSLSLAVVEQKPIYIDNVSMANYQPHPYLQFNTASEIALPLLMGKQVFGVLNVQSMEKDGFPEAHIFMLQSLADQVAIAISNAHFYEMIANFNEELEIEVVRRMSELQTAYDRLDKLDRNKSDFISIISHELRTPITVLLGYTDILLQEPAIAENLYHQQLVRGMSKGAYRLHELVEVMFDMVKLDNQDHQLRIVDINLRVLFEGIHENLEAAFRQRRLNWTVDGLAELPSLSGDEELVYKAFYQLILNSIKFTPDGGKIGIEGRFIEETNEVELIINDTGIGIDPEHHEIIFNKFYQTGEVQLHSTSKTKFKGGGPGIGLAIVKGIVALHNGRIWVESDRYDEADCPGSRFFIRLPIKRDEE